MSKKELTQVRAEILLKDKALLSLFAERMQLVEVIGELKKIQELPLEDAHYFQSALEEKQLWGQSLGLEEVEVKLFCELLQALAIQRMKKNVSL